MYWRIFILAIMIFQFSSCSAFKVNQYLMTEDAYWNQIVKEVEVTKSSFMAVLKKRNLLLFHQIQNDSQDSNLLNFWGQSLNFDSGAKKQIVKDQIIDDLFLTFKLKPEKKIVHAGVTHTYGYLFSTIETPYGYKRKRWIEKTLNEGFSFKGKSLSPETNEGGLLSNVTYFMGTLAFKNGNDRAALNSLTNVSSEVKNFNFYSLTLEHLEEELPGYTLRTTLVRLPFKKSNEENSHLLVYSIYYLSMNKEYLITAFPITERAYLKITSKSSLGRKQPIQVRYNAYIKNVAGEKLIGRRRMWKESR